MSLLGSFGSTVEYIALETPVAPKVEYSDEEWIKERIRVYSVIYEVSEEVMNHIVKEESGYDINAINSSPIEFSIGLVQINLSVHFINGVTKEMALDPEFSLDFLARNLKEGRCHMWTTCPY